MVRETTDYFQIKLGLSEGERFWLAAAATLLVGATISKQLGLIDFDIMSMRKFLLEQLRKQRNTVMEMSLNAADPEVQLTRVKNFMNSNRNWVVTDALAKQGSQPGSCVLVPDGVHYQHMREFVLRYATADKKIMVSEEKLRAWCNVQEINYRQLLKTLQEHKYCDRPRKPRALTAGTRLNSATEIVLIFDLTFLPNATLITEDYGV